jgi:hypothetical protein
MGAGFVKAHEAAVPHHVGSEDSDQLPFESLFHRAELYVKGDGPTILAADTLD